MSFVEIKEVAKIYQPGGPDTAVRVLDGVSLTVARGECVSLMGPSGSGKSTLLGVLGAMNRPTTGTVRMDGVDIYALAEERRADFRRDQLGFVFQQHHLMPYLNALENVLLPLVPVRGRADGKKARALDALARVGLADKARRLPGQLSGGEQGRLAIARAIVHAPPLLLADEPTGALDSQAGEEIMRELQRLNAGGQTIFLVTHNPATAALAHRTLRIRDGKLE